jgi:acyl-CoA synthetase (AMP-forming)/AMP-acid ligase II
LNAQAAIGDGLDEPGVPLWRDGTPAVQDPPSPQPDSPALYLHTSGTTSRPKGVALSHAQLLASAANIAATYRLEPEDRSMLVMPLFHVHGLLAGLLATLTAGGAVVIPGPFSASTFWNDVETHRATWTTAVPTILQILHLSGQSHDRGRGVLRFMRSCSSALGPTLWSQLEERFQCPVVEAYGMTEASHQMASNPLPPEQRKPGSVGRATGTTITIRDEHGNDLGRQQVGEVCLTGPSVIRHYFQNPQADQASFFGEVFRTGDQGYLDEDGYLFLTGRLKELINRGGEKISPVKLDEALASHPHIVEVRCFGLADAKYGEIVAAAVVASQPLTGEELRSFLSGRLPPHEIPERWFFVETLPKSATGKVSRVALSRTFAS